MVGAFAPAHTTITTHPTSPPPTPSGPSNHGVLPGQSVTLEIPAAGARIRAVVVRVRTAPDGRIDLGLQFVASQWDELRRCAFLLFHERSEPVTVDVTDIRGAAGVLVVCR